MITRVTDGQTDRQAIAYMLSCVKTARPLE